MMTPRKNIDLQILECFDALVRERSVSRAAERMRLSQSTMSEVLARLRKHFNDPLLVRGRGGMQPTPLARDLMPTVHDLVARLQALAIAGQAFDPATCSARFRLATSDYTQFLLMPNLVDRMARQAPASSIDVLAVNIMRVEEALDFGEIDLALAYFPNAPASLRCRTLFSERYVGMAAPGHAALAPRLTAEAFASFRHIAVAPSGLNFFRRAIDAELAKLGLTRTVAVTSPHFLIAAHLVARSDLVLCLPSRAAQRLTWTLPIATFELPLELPDFEISMYWHDRTHRAEPYRWFRSEVQQALKREQSLPSA